MKYMQPTPKEIDRRKDLVKRFTTLIESFGLGVTVQPVGSYVTGLYTPTSDIDMVLTSQSKTRQPSLPRTSTFLSLDLYSVLLKLRDSNFASNIDSVMNASVPLIRITDKITGIEIDVTASDTHAVNATNAVQKWMETDTKLIKMLVMVVKTFLSIRMLGKTYTGGINSYLLVWMVVGWVKQEWPKRIIAAKDRSNDEIDVNSLTLGLMGLSMSSSSSRLPRASATNRTSHSQAEPLDYGTALIAFFKFYGLDFDYYQTAIKIHPRPSYQNKTYPYSRYPTTQHYLLSIFDPADGSIDMGSKAYAIKHVKASFKEAYETLKGGMPRGRLGDSLGTTLGGDFGNFEKKRKKVAGNY
jgi:non-canonical poly(A) RNA polymerase PAPD5/7